MVPGMTAGKGRNKPSYTKLTAPSEEFDETTDFTFTVSLNSKT